MPFIASRLPPRETCRRLRRGARASSGSSVQSDFVMAARAQVGLLLGELRMLRGEPCRVRHLRPVAGVAERLLVAGRALGLRLGGIRRVDIDELRLVRHAHAVTVDAVARRVTHGARGCVSHPVGGLPLGTVSHGKCRGLDASGGILALMAQVALHVARGRVTLETAVHVVGPNPPSRAAVGGRGVTVGARSGRGARGVVDPDAVGDDHSLERLLVTRLAARVRHRGGVTVRGARLAGSTRAAAAATRTRPARPRPATCGSFGTPRSREAEACVPARKARTIVAGDARLPADDTEDAQTEHACEHQPDARPHEPPAAPRGTSCLARR